MTKTKKTVKRPKIGIYRRVSTKGQAEEGISLDVQLQKCRAEADHVYGKDLYDYDDFCDDGYPGKLGLRLQDSRKTKHRPALSDMMDGVAAGKYDAVFVYRIDRLFRSISMAAYLLKNYFQKYEVGLLSVQDRIDATTPAGRMMIYVMAVIAEYFLDWMSENITAALRQARTQGRFLGVAPYGWRRPTEQEKQQGTTGSLVRDEEQGRWVVQMKDWYLSGWGTRRIVEALHDKGIESPAGGQWWYTNIVRNTITNPTHAGLVRVGDGTLVPGDFYDQRYYDESVLQQIETKARQRSQRGSSALAAAHYPLANVLTCGHCGRRMRGRRASRSGTLRYRCTTPIHKRTKQCVRNSKPARVIEDCVLSVVRDLARREDIQQLARHEAAKLLDEQDQHIERDIARYEDDLAKTQKHMDQWANLYLDSQVPREELERKSQELYARKQSQEAVLAEARQRWEQRAMRENNFKQVAKRLQSFPTVWDHLNLEERRELLESVVEYAEMSRLDNGETLLRVKLHFADEREFHIPDLHRATSSGLTIRQLATLELHHQGLDKDKIAAQLGVTRSCASSTLSSITRKLQLRDLNEAYEHCRDQIDYYRPWLPLSGRMQRPAGRKARQLLTDKQQQVCLLRAQGTHVRTIAKQLDMAVNTVYVHLHNIRQLMGTATDRQAAEKALRMDLIKSEEEIRPRFQDRELAFAHYVLEGKSDQWIEEKFEVSDARVRALRRDVCEKLGTNDLTEVPQWFRDEIQRCLPALPLGPLPNRQQESTLGTQTRKVLKLRDQGKCYEEISDILDIAYQTVSYHLQRARKVLDADSPDHALEIAKEQGLI